MNHAFTHRLWAVRTPGVQCLLASRSMLYRYDAAMQAFERRHWSGLLALDALIPRPCIQGIAARTDACHSAKPPTLTAAL